MPIYGHYKSKPRPGAGIDWSQPLAQGLMGFYTLNEGAGPSLYDATAKGPALSLYSGTAWGSGPQGTGLACASASNGAYASLPSWLQMQYPISVAVGFRVLATGSNGPIFGVEDGSGNDLWLWYFSLGNVKFGLKQHYGTSYLASTVTPAAGTDLIASTSIPNGSSVSIPLFINGVTDYTGTGINTTTVTYTGSPTISVGSMPGDTTASQSLISWAAWWDRVLSVQDHAQLAANPWQVFGAPRSYFLFKASTVAATKVRRTLSDRAGSRGVA